MDIVPHRSWPNALNVHQTRGALKTPCVSYTITVVSLLMPSASAAAAKAAYQQIILVTVGSSRGHTGGRGELMTVI